MYGLIAIELATCERKSAPSTILSPDVSIFTRQNSLRVVTTSSNEMGGEKRDLYFYSVCAREVPSDENLGDSELSLNV